MTRNEGSREKSGSRTETAFCAAVDRTYLRYVIVYLNVLGSSQSRTLPPISA